MTVGQGDGRYEIEMEFLEPFEHGDRQGEEVSLIGVIRKN